MEIIIDKSDINSINEGDVYSHYADETALIIMSNEKYRKLLGKIAEKDIDLQNEVIPAIGGEQSCREDDTISYYSIVEFL